MAMKDSSKNFFHGHSSLIFAHSLWRLSYFVKKLASRTKLHYKINEFNVIVCLIILDNVRMINLLQNRNFFMQSINLFLGKFLFWNNFNCYLVRLIRFISCLEDFPKAAWAQDFRINIVLLFQLCNTSFDFWIFCFKYILFSVFVWGRKATHFYLLISLFI
jgi:hypothetical protein